MDEDNERLRRLEIEDEVESRRMSIAEKKAVQREMKRQYGRDWRKILGVVKVNKESLQALHGINPDLRDRARLR